MEITPEHIRQLFLYLPVFILSLSVHEFAHAWTANKLGDPTPKLQGRLTLDPISHISVLGTLVCPIVGILSGFPFIAWAKPVQVDIAFFKKKRAYNAFVALAGPLSNVLIAIFLAIVMGILVRMLPTASVSGVEASPLMGAALDMINFAIFMNIFLAFFNMVPLPPLDGAHVLQGFIGDKLAAQLDSVRSYTQLIFIAMAFQGAFAFLLPPTRFCVDFLMKTFVF